MSAAVGDTLEITLERPAHGGTCVGRADGQVVFARHGIPGERVRVEVTALGQGGRFVRGDVIQVIEASADRREPACPHAHPGGCGGCDWQHVTLQRQREMKAEIVREQLTRLGGLPVDHPLLTGLTVEPCGDDVDGLAYRTRMDFVADARGRLGLRGSRSHDVIALPGCPLAVAAINEHEAMHQPWQAGGTVRFAAATDGVAVVAEGAPVPIVREHVTGADFEVAADGFWQVHRNAPRAFTQLAAELLQPQAGESLLDLYGGVGLFARTLAPRLGQGGRVALVESDAAAIKLARRNLRRFAYVQVVPARVDRWLAQRSIRRTDLVLLDPPRTGAGAKVLAEVVRLQPRALLYVACDPAALGRDVATLSGLGYRLDALRAIDAFPQTQHIETFARFIPA